MIRIEQGHALDCLGRLEPASVSCVITSPPFLGLRSYGTDPQTWGGDPDCRHVFGESSRRVKGGQVVHGSILDGRDLSGWQGGNVVNTGASCSCGAWLGELGSEPTVDRYIADLVSVFDAVRRVLHPSGVLCVELGDSYAGSGNGAGDHRQDGASLSLNPDKYVGQKPGHQDLPAKNLLLVPFRFAIAMQSAGWILRSVMPWVRRNAMPESVTDRPASAVSYVFLFAQQGKYFWDSEAVRVSAGENTHSRGNGDGGPKMREKAATMGMHAGWGDSTRTVLSSRSMRNSDLFFASWQGLLENEQGDPLALVVNPQPLSDKRISRGHVGGGQEHFAAFAEKLVEPLIRAGSSQAGVCPTCRAPWVREKRPTDAYKRALDAASESWYQRYENPFEGTGRKAGNKQSVSAQYETTGWRASCPHAGPPVPSVVLDPFAGSFTTAVVAQRLGRDSIGCELNPAYIELGKRRLYGPLLAPAYDEAAGA